MAITNPFSISYGDFSAGGSSDRFLLHGPYVIDKSYSRLRLVFEVVVVATGASSLQSYSDDLETAFALRDQDFTINIGGSAWEYVQGENALNVTASATKTGNRDTDRGDSRAYTCVVEAELPATDRDGLRDLEVGVTFAPSRQRTVAMRGTYTANDPDSASEAYLSGFDGEAATILTAIGAGAAWELVDEGFTRDRNDHLAQFSRSYVELLASQSSSALDDPAIKDHRISFADKSAHPGDSRAGVHRMRRVEGAYSCALDVEVGTNLQTAFSGTVRPHIVALFRSEFDPQAWTVEQQSVAYDETGKRMSVSITFLYQPSSAASVVEMSQSVAIREMRTIDYTPTHGENEFAAEADVGWAVRERHWTRTVIVIGSETPKMRLGQRASSGEAGTFSGPIGGESGPDGRHSGNINKSGWNLVANTSQITEQWIGDPSGEQILHTALSETVVERWHEQVGGGGPITPGGVAAPVTGPFTSGRGF